MSQTNVLIAEVGTRDRLLESGQEPPVGTHIVTPRRGYTHHGIYVGRGNVVQYAGLACGLRRGPVEEVALRQFAQGRPVRVRLEESRRFDSHEVARRARSRVGENRYRLLTNNCEHFCEWCVRGEPRSYQVDAWLWRPLLTLRLAISWVTKVLTVGDTKATARWTRTVVLLQVTLACATVPDLGGANPTITVFALTR
jgi:hypothetical protein